MNYLPKNHFDLKSRGFDRFNDSVTDIWSSDGFETKFFVDGRRMYDELITLLEAQSDWNFRVNLVIKHQSLEYRVDVSITLKPIED